MYTDELTVPRGFAKAHTERGALQSLAELIGAQYDIALESLNMYVAHYGGQFSDISSSADDAYTVAGFDGFGQTPYGGDYSKAPLRALSLYAHAYISAVHTALTAADAIADVLGGNVKEVNDIVSRLGPVKKVIKPARDSIAHIDERVQGLARRKEIQLKAVDKNGIVAEQGLLITGWFVNAQFVITGESGSPVHVDITIENLRKVKKHLEELFNYLTTVP